jgi:nicotinamide-nucleotide amidase
MQPLINQIHRLLIKNRKTIAVAESCTGGLLSNILTQKSASSKYFIAGVVSYSNKAKKKILKIPDKIITQKGAVSKDVTKLMANSIRKILDADFGIGITGIAGPKGRNQDTPKGTVFIAINSKNKKICKRYLFKGSRNKIRKKAALKALELLLSCL